MTTWKPKLAESQSFNSKFFLAENLWSDVSTTLFTDFRRAMENLRDYEVNVWMYGFDNILISPESIEGFQYAPVVVYA